MIPKKEAENILKGIKEDQKATLPVLLQLSEMTSISSLSKRRITNRIHIAMYNDRYASKRTFYKTISIQYPKQNEQ